VTIIYRMYDEDPSVAGCTTRTRKQQFWGSADPAVVERLVPGKHGDGDHWEELPPCTDFGAALFQSSFTDLYPVFRQFPATPASCPMATLSDELFPSLILFGGWGNAWIKRLPRNLFIFKIIHRFQPHPRNNQAPGSRRATRRASRATPTTTLGTYTGARRRRRWGKTSSFACKAVCPECHGACTSTRAWRRLGRTMRATSPSAPSTCSTPRRRTKSSMTTTLSTSTRKCPAGG
jgi:hypothetical protein